MTGSMTESPQVPPTVSHFLGEMTWLLTQSPLHRELAIRDLEWLVMPALLYEQFYLFRDGDRPIGLATWAKTDTVGEAKLDRGLLEPGDRLTLEEWQGGDRLWLVDLVAPFATNDNKQREVMFADLISGPLKGRAFKFHRTDPLTGARTAQSVDANAGDMLAEQIKEAVERTD